MHGNYYWYGLKGLRLPSKHKSEREILKGKVGTKSQKEVSC